MVGQIVGAKRHQPSIRAGGVDVAIAQALQVEGPGVLKSHARDAKSVGLFALEENIPFTQAWSAENG